MEIKDIIDQAIDESIRKLPKIDVRNIEKTKQEIKKLNDKINKLKDKLSDLKKNLKIYRQTKEKIANIKDMYTWDNNRAGFKNDCYGDGKVGLEENIQSINVFFYVNIEAHAPTNNRPKSYDNKITGDFELINFEISTSKKTFVVETDNKKLKKYIKKELTKHLDKYNEDIESFVDILVNNRQSYSNYILDQGDWDSSVIAKVKDNMRMGILFNISDDMIKKYGIDKKSFINKKIEKLSKNILLKSNKKLIS